MPPCRRPSRGLRQDSGDEIVKPLGVLLRVHRGDLRAGLEKKKKTRDTAAGQWRKSHTRLRSRWSAFKYPVFDRLGGVGGFLLGVVMLEDVYDGHEVHLLPGSSCGAKQTPPDENRHPCKTSDSDR